MKRVIITGPTGAIGISLIKYLLNEKIEILAIIRKGSIRAKNLPNDNKLKILECDLSNLEKLKLDDNKYDVFFHFAWDGTFGEARNDLYTQNLNVKYTLDALELAKRTGCKTFIGAGSQAEYGRVNGTIFNNTPTNPENGYGIAKLAAGQMSRILANKYNIKHIWTRIFSVYGPYDGENTMIMSSIKKMIDENVSPDYTKGEQLWDYLYVDDVAKAMYLIAQNGKNGKVYNVGNGKQRYLYEYINVIKNLINPQIVLNLGKIQYSDKQVMQLKPDITELTEDTGFVPKVEFEEGIAKTINYYKEKMKNEKD